MSLIRYDGLNLEKLNQKSLRVNSNKIEDEDKDLMVVPEDGNKHLYIVDDNDLELDVNMIIDEDAVEAYDLLYLSNFLDDYQLLEQDSIRVYEGTLIYHYDSVDQCYYATLDKFLSVDNLHKYNIEFSSSINSKTLYDMQFYPGYTISSTKKLLYGFEGNPHELPISYSISAQLYEEDGSHYIEFKYMNPNDLGDIEVDLLIEEVGFADSPVVYYRSFEFSDYGQISGEQGISLTLPDLSNSINVNHYHQVSINSSTYNNVKFTQLSQPTGDVVLYYGVLAEGGNTLEPPDSSHPIEIWTSENSGVVNDHVWIEGTYSADWKDTLIITDIGEEPAPIYYADDWSFTTEPGSSYIYTSIPHTIIDDLDSSHSYDFVITLWDQDVVFSNISLTLSDDVLSYGESPPSAEHPLYIYQSILYNNSYTIISFYTSDVLGSGYGATVRVYDHYDAPLYINDRKSTEIKSTPIILKLPKSQKYFISQLEKNEKTGNFIVPIDLKLFNDDVIYCHLLVKNENYQNVFSKPCKFYILKESSIPDPLKYEPLGKFCILDQPFCYRMAKEEENMILPVSILSDVEEITNENYYSCISNSGIILNDLLGWGTSNHLFKDAKRPCYGDMVLYKHVASNKIIQYQIPVPPEYVTFTGNYPFKVGYADIIESDSYSYVSSTDGLSWNILTSVAESSQSRSGYTLYLAGWNHQDVLKIFYIAPLDSNNTDLEITISGNLASLGDPFDLTKQLDGSYIFRYCNYLYSAEDLIIPSTIKCTQMFYNCGNLVYPPTIDYISDVSLQDYQFKEMFMYCSSLEDASTMEFPDIELAYQCYQGMFRASGLKIPPSLDSTQPAYDCYAYMFQSTPMLISSTETGSYTEEFRIPSQGTIDTSQWSTGSSIANYMFTYTSGTFTGIPDLNTSYYIDYQQEPEPKSENLEK